MTADSSDLHARITPVVTDRLVLRTWRATDADAFAAMGADPLVMRHYPSLMTREQSDASFARVQKHWHDRGFGFWAVETRAIPGQIGGEFIGFVGMQVPRFEAHFTPCVEIGWRLRPEFWGKGYATEAARASLEFGFTTLKLREIVAMTVPANVQSIAVMERLGMQRNPADDFDNPLVEGPLKRHILYRIQAPR